MLKNSRSKIALWIALGVAFAAGAVSLLVLALVSGSDEERGSEAAPSTSWYTTRPPARTAEPPEPSEPSTPVTVVTRTVVAVPSSRGGGDGPSSLITAFGSLLSGAAAVGTLLHAVQLSRRRDSDA